MPQQPAGQMVPYTLQEDAGEIRLRSQHPVLRQYGDTAPRTHCLRNAAGREVGTGVGGEVAMDVLRVRIFQIFAATGAPRKLA